jgi:hypothetical protein
MTATFEQRFIFAPIILPRYILALGLLPEMNYHPSYLVPTPYFKEHLLK